MLTKGIVGTRGPHAWCMKGCAWEKRTRPQEPIVVMQCANKRYAGSDGDSGSQNGGTKRTNYLSANQSPSFLSTCRRMCVLMGGYGTYMVMPSTCDTALQCST